MNWSKTLTDERVARADAKKKNLRTTQPLYTAPTTLLGVTLPATERSERSGERNVAQAPTVRPDTSIGAQAPTVRPDTSIAAQEPDPTLDPNNQISGGRGARESAAPDLRGTLAGGHDAAPTPSAANAAPQSAPSGSPASGPPAPPEPAEPVKVAAAVAPAASRTSAKHAAQSPLFRVQALAAYRRGERAASALRITGVSEWTLLAAVSFALLLAAGFTALGTVEETSPARGVLRASFGVQPVVSLLAGTIREVNAQAGAHVEEDELIAKLEATPIEAQLDEAEQRLRATQQQWRTTRSALDESHRHSIDLLGGRKTLLEQRRALQSQRIGRRGAHAKRMADPELQPLIEQTVRDQTVEAVETARDELLHTSEELSSVRLQMATEQSEYDQQIAAGEQRVTEARTRRDSVKMLLAQTELRASSAGKLESLRAHPGQVVQAGEWIARVVRDQVPSTIAAFVPERDVAFLRVGASANVELDQLPVGEFGHVAAHVVRVGAELADASELNSALGEGALSGPHVRVELKLDDRAISPRVRPFLRPGTLVTARIVLRDRRLLAIVFEPVRRWLD